VTNQQAQQSNEFTIVEAANHCKKSIYTIQSWIKHKIRPLPVRRANYHTTYINKKTFDIYQKAMRPQGRPKILPSYQVLIKLREEHTARQISLRYDVSENAVWMALNKGKK